VIIAKCFCIQGFLSWTKSRALLKDTLKGTATLTPWDALMDMLTRFARLLCSMSTGPIPLTWMVKGLSIDYHSYPEAGMLSSTGEVTL